MEEFEGGLPEITEENVDAIYDELLVDMNQHWDCESEFRDSGEETDIESDYCRHYESKSVAFKLRSGKWVGWTYWYGGGKYGNPEEIDWMDEAYFLDIKEEEKVVTVRTFTKRGD
tara:strand:+ start:1247 stop:1591 length:345 start_codon:yes stop_codon:yes gene_type:complete